jgi:IS30 family transposase
LEMTKATQGLSGLLRWVAKQLNNRPRLGLGFKTPNDACY